MKRPELKLELTKFDRRSRLSRGLFILAIALVSGFIGELYASIVYPTAEPNYYRGFRTGFCIGLLVSALETFYERSGRNNWIRRIPFLPSLIIRILILTLIVRISFVLNEVITNYLTGQSWADRLGFQDQFRDTLFSMGLIVLFVVFLQMTSLIGFKRFSNLILGRYFRPVHENRVFMFVDLIGSSVLARELGNVNFHKYLTEFFRAVDPAIVQSGGEIVSYVGDAVIVSWPLSDNKTKNGRCIRALQLMDDQIGVQSQTFKEKYGCAPEFRAALHGGDVVVGECGDSRKQITFLGDVINTAARIEGESKVLNEVYLVSETIVRCVKCPEGAHFEPVGERKLKGIEDRVQLYRIVFS